MKTFCTIITSDFAYFAIALYRSYSRFSEIPLHVLCIDHTHDDVLQKFAKPAGVTFHQLDELELNETGMSIVGKYQHAPDVLRWCLKSVWLEHLLRNGIADHAIFIDPDIYFYQNPDFLFGELKSNAILISPHWRSTDPTKDAVNFELNFCDGIYNGGFLGATMAGLPALQWLTSACLYKCEVKPERGLYVDQKYYDLLQSRFAGVASLRHKGCNVANWNQVDCKREIVGDQILINGTDPIIFIHFTKSTIRGIRNGKDILLTPFLKEYEEALRLINPAYISPTFESQATPSPKGPLSRIVRKLKRLKKSLLP